MRLTRTTRLSRALLAGVLLSLTATACTEASGSGSGDSGGGSAAATGDVEMVEIYPETGPLAAVAGETISAATEAMVDIWNDEHPDRQVNIQTCNDEGNPERGISCAQRYASSADIVLGPHFGAVYAAAAPMLGQDALAVTATPHAHPAGDTGIFQAIPTPDAAFESAIDYMLDEGWDSFALLTSSDTTGKSALESARAVAEEKGITLVNEEFDPASQDLTGQISSLVAQDPDGLFVWSSGAQVVTALRGIDNVGADLPVLLNYSSMSRALMELAKDVLPEELLFTGSAAFDPDSIDDADRAERIKVFADKYAEIAGNQPDWTAFAVADAFTVAMSAAEQAGDRDGMVEWLESGEQIVAYNGIYSYSDDDHVGLDGNPIEILRWDGDGWAVA
jgi:branched-chain amino acid transport system substrate-binding protein